MKKKLINIYWFKRDLRLEDNEPLYEASKQSEKLLLIYFLEDKLISDPHYSNFHWNFVKQSIEDINLSIGKKSILFLNCDPIEGFKKISEKYKIKSIYSHMETASSPFLPRAYLNISYSSYFRFFFSSYPKNIII